MEYTACEKISVSQVLGFYEEVIHEDLETAGSILLMCLETCFVAYMFSGWLCDDSSILINYLHTCLSYRWKVLSVLTCISCVSSFTT
jgi:hypothetical protein